MKLKVIKQLYFYNFEEKKKLEQNRPKWDYPKPGLKVERLGIIFCAIVTVMIHFIFVLFDREKSALHSERSYRAQE